MAVQTPNTPDKSASVLETRQPAPAKTAPATPIDVCPVCNESTNLALIKGCLRCLKCGFKWDCNGW
jgi:hypothetical protein